MQMSLKNPNEGMAEKVMTQHEMGREQMEKGNWFLDYDEGKQWQTPAILESPGPCPSLEGQPALRCKRGCCSAASGSSISSDGFCTGDGGHHSVCSIEGSRSILCSPSRNNKLSLGLAQTTEAAPLPSSRGITIKKENRQLKFYSPTGGMV